MSKWRPIETAPRDGSWFLGWCDSWAAPFAVYSHKGRYRGYDGRAIHQDFAPTHWMPLPDPPESEDLSLA